MDTVTAAFQRSLEGSRGDSLCATSTMSTVDYILSGTIYIFARRVKSTPIYGACEWRRPRWSRVG